MRLTPIDLVHRDFRRCFRGYSPAQVDDLLREVAADLEECLTENARLRDESARLTGELERFRSMESTLKEALILAQRAAEDARSAARAEGEAIVAEARGEARETVERAERDVQELRHRRLRLAAEIRALLQAEIGALDGLEAGGATNSGSSRPTAVPANAEHPVGLPGSNGSD